MNEMTLNQAQEMVAQRPSNLMADRALAEIKAQVYMAKQLPRNETVARSRILRSCQRPGLASKAIYSYPKGGKNVTGPSIRLAEAIAQSWGNIDFNILTIEQRECESSCMAYCWDLETNTRASRSFIVPHKISTKNGEKVLTDPREIRELILNQGARYLRTCILSIIPGDIVDDAIDACNKTMSGNNRIPLIDRLRDMVGLFEERYSVPLSSIEKYFGYPLEAFTQFDGQTLAGIYNNLRDGDAKREDYFQLPKVKDQEEPQQPDDDTQKTEKKSKKGDEKQVSIHDL